MEYIGRVVFNTNGLLYSNSVLGTYSHTNMIYALGVVGWGVGGIEAKYVMRGQVIWFEHIDVAFSPGEKSYYFHMEIHSIHA